MVGQYRFGDLIADAHHRVQRCHGLLKDHGDARTAEKTELLGRERGEIRGLGIAILEGDVAGYVCCRPKGRTKNTRKAFDWSGMYWRHCARGGTHIGVLRACKPAQDRQSPGQRRKQRVRGQGRVEAWLEGRQAQDRIGALGSALGAWAYADGGWRLASAIGLAFPVIAIAAFAFERPR